MDGLQPAPVSAAMATMMGRFHCWRKVSRPTISINATAK